MEIPRRFNRTRFSSIVRYVSAGTLLSAAAAMAFVAANPSGPMRMGKSDVKSLTHNNHVMSPASARLTWQETVAGVQPGSPQYGLFGCQVGLSVGQCYDPYQMRHAYQIDSLISAGFDGYGHAVVIVDAFQNPNLVSQIATYNTFYGLPPTNLTQIAPDGLTPFVPGDPNMTGWAEEISLDVEWAHNIAPGANIVLVLAKTNQDADILSALRYAVDNNLGDVISMSFGEDERCQGGPAAELLSASMMCSWRRRKSTSRCSPLPVTRVRHYLPATVTLGQKQCRRRPAIRWSQGWVAPSYVQRTIALRPSVAIPARIRCLGRT